MTYLGFCGALDQAALAPDMFLAKTEKDDDPQGGWRVKNVAIIGVQCLAQEQEPGYVERNS